MGTSTFLLLVLCVSGVLSYGSFRLKIPNGDHVPHPCKPNFIWHGVGHKNAQGGGSRNPFGLDFASNGQNWTAALCRLDSDGDGLTNGQELGDPDCVWTPGSIPPRTTNISHPGVCDPWNSVKCVSKNSWLDCSSFEEFACDAINDPDVLNMTIRFPRTKVPAQETTYICFSFELPSDQEYHLIATKPYIDNKNVMHHMVLTACEGMAGRLIPEPRECLMGSAGCTEMIGLWSLGMTGQCFNSQAGIRIGKGYTTLVTLQIHWTNPDEVDTWYDSSGLILYYTPKLRQYNAAVLQVGQNYLNIPPGIPSVVQRGTCTSRCSRLVMRGPIHIASAFNHMHYLGIRQNVTLTRPGLPPVTIADDNPYSYDSPKTHTFDTPIVMKPGDELQTLCTFQSRSRDTTTMFGEGSYDEMCINFMTYFPAENLTNKMCSQWKDVDICDLPMKCPNFLALLNSSAPSTAAMTKKILDHCDPAGYCRPECPAAIQQVQEENWCIKHAFGLMEDRYLFMEDAKFLKFVAAMKSCDHKPAPSGNMTTPTTPRPQGPGQPQTDPGSMFLNLIKQLDSRPLLQNIVMNVNYNTIQYPGNGSQPKN
ncbi:peptidyl-glycine alpha-amidating monooxygenase A-like [Littorina saxatilis]|uniref:peptidyl-glycine alpha-amidating monooxygenase A-like n=1 Tax=Littorina saxatilis TaxID=31220 RepID=UPI0038B46BD4